MSNLSWLSLGAVAETAGDQQGPWPPPKIEKFLI
jgi:hypothetical protein